MKAFAKKFYASRAWRDCREGFLTSKHYICERCGNPVKIAHHKTPLTPTNITDPYIALSYPHLEALCMDCHSIPANDDTEIAARSFAQRSFEAEQQELLGRRARILKLKIEAEVFA